MKALSIRQPWAWLIVNGIKSVENRSWPTNYRGKFLVHAGTKFAITDRDFDAWRAEMQAAIDSEQSFGGLKLPRRPQDYRTGGIVGMVELIDCVTECEDEYDQLWHEPGMYAFILDNAGVLPFMPYPGKLNFFEVHPQ